MQPESESVPSVAVAARMRPALIRYFRRGGSAFEAEDLAHDVLVRCLAQPLQGDHAQIRNYVFRAARNCWYDRRRRYATRGATLQWDDETMEFPHKDLSPEQVVSLEQETAAVARRFEELDRRARDIILWIKVEEMQIDAVARRLGVSRSTVNKTLARGLAYLRAVESALRSPHG